MHNIGKVLKVIAIIFFILSLIASFIIGVSLATDWYPIEGLLLIFVAPIVEFVGFAIFYGFGELVDRICLMESYSRGGDAQTVIQTQATIERNTKLEKLRAQGLITEEEYQQALAKDQQEA